jgi:hypothetical protein
MKKRRSLFAELKEGMAYLAAERRDPPPDLEKVVSLARISDEAEYARATTVLNWLLDAGGADEKHVLAPLVQTIGNLIGQHESRRNPYIGSGFDDYLKQEGRLDEATETARKRIGQIKRK